MDVKYKFGQDKKANKKILQSVSRIIYTDNKKLKFLNILDFALSTLAVFALFVVFGFLSNYQDVFDYYGEGEKALIFRYALVLIVVIFGIYTLILRPAVLNQITWDKSCQYIKGHSHFLRIGENGLYQQVEEQSSYGVIGYDMIMQVINLQEHLVIIFNDTRYTAIPFTAFANEEYRIAFEKALRDKISIV